MSEREAIAAAAAASQGEGSISEKIAAQVAETVAEEVAVSALLKGAETALDLVGKSAADLFEIFL